MRRATAIAVAAALVTAPTVAQTTPAAPAAMPVAQAEQAGPRAVSVRVDLRNSGLGTLYARRLGANHIYGRSPSTDFTDPRPDAFTSPTDDRFSDQVSGSGIGSVRFPGGTVANLYRFDEDSQVGAAGLGPVPNTFDVARWKSLVTQGRVEPGPVAVNFASITPFEAGDFVQEVLDPASDGGRVQPTYFEVGNEFGYQDQQYWMRWLPAGASDDAKAEAFVSGRAVEITVSAGRPDDHRDGAELPDPAEAPSPQREFSVKYGPITPGTLRVTQGGEPVSPERYTVDADEGTFTFLEAPDRADGGLDVSFTRPAIGFVDYARAMRSGAARAGVNPADIRICPGFNTFTQGRQQALLRALTRAALVPDCISHHVYHSLNVDGSRLEGGAGFWGRVHDRVLGDNDRTVAQTAAFAQRIRTTFPGAPPSLVVSEFGMNRFTVGGDAATGYRYLGGLGGAVSVTRLWQRLLATARPAVLLRHALVTPSVDRAGMLLPDSQQRSRATGRVYELIGRMRTGSIQATAISGNPRRSTRAGRTYPLLTALASRRGPRLQLLLVNASPFGKLDVDLTVAGQPNGFLRRPGRIRTLTDASAPVRDPSRALAESSGGLGLTSIGTGRRLARPDRPVRLPPRSVTLVTLTGGGR